MTEGRLLLNMKRRRHEKIQEIIDNKEIATQEELADELKNEGYNVTQATVSRDIKILGLIKAITPDGLSRYTSFKSNGHNISGKLLSVFSESFVSAKAAGNIVVVKTLPGMAQAAASSIDSLKWADIIGTIAGDDTIMIVCGKADVAGTVADRFNELADY